MAWQEQTAIIVMVTNTIELTKVRTYVVGFVFVFIYVKKIYYSCFILMTTDCVSMNRNTLNMANSELIV